MSEVSEFVVKKFKEQFPEYEEDDLQDILFVTNDHWKIAYQGSEGDGRVCEVIISFEGKFYRIPYEYSSWGGSEVLVDHIEEVFQKTVTIEAFFNAKGEQISHV